VQLIYYTCINYSILCQCLFCSTVSSSLSGAAANCWDDILKMKLSNMSEQRKAQTNRLLGRLRSLVLSCVGRVINVKGLQYKLQKSILTV